ncbi:hypothetical protein CLI64_01090 [Nostoc sp. CENA543]|nr:hypothetical protein CLI64_01090 [Nostoc sp. CENA543]
MALRFVKLASNHTICVAVLGIGNWVWGIGHREWGIGHWAKNIFCFLFPIPYSPFCIKYFIKIK